MDNLHSAKDVLRSFENSYPGFCSDLRRVIDIIPERRGTFTFQYRFLCHAIIEWNGKVPNVSVERIDKLLTAVMRLVKKHKSGSKEFRLLLLDYRNAGYKNLCLMIMNQKNEQQSLSRPRKRR